MEEEHGHVSFIDLINSSGIYCSGPILHRVQTAKLFSDDKYFVDMSLRQPPGRPHLLFLPPEPLARVFFRVCLQTSFSPRFTTCPWSTRPPSCGTLWTPTLTNRGQSSRRGLRWTGMKSETVCSGQLGPRSNNLTAFITTIRPKFLARIVDKEFCAWAEEMHKTWKSLSRKVKKVIFLNWIYMTAYKSLKK